MSRPTPEDYYYGKFREDFLKFIEKSKIHEHNDGSFIPIHDLKKENLEHISPENKVLFIYSLAFTVLIDTVMYSYFKLDYPDFQKLTKYPKFEYGITNVIVYPWRIAQIMGGLTTFEIFSEFFIEDLRKFFTRYTFQEATWETVRDVMLKDKDVTGGTFGEIFKNKLEIPKNH